MTLYAKLPSSHTEVVLCWYYLALVIWLIVSWESVSEWIELVAYNFIDDFVNG